MPTLDMRGTKWSEERPKYPGWYLVREKPTEAHPHTPRWVIEVHEAVYRGLWYTSFDGMAGPVYSAPAWWEYCLLDVIQEEGEPSMFVVTPRDELRRQSGL